MACYLRLERVQLRTAVRLWGFVSTQEHVTAETALNCRNLYRVIRGHAFMKIKGVMNCEPYINYIVQRGNN